MNYETSKVDDRGTVYTICDEAAPHTYRTELPNIIDEMNLTVCAYRLYGHLKRVAGDGGACWQGTRRLAKNCNMSVGSVVKAKRELKEKNLIRIDIVDGTFHNITITDIWIDNYERFTAPKTESETPTPKATYSTSGVHQMNRCSPGERGCSPGELKKNPLRRNTGKKCAPEISSSKLDEYPEDTRSCISEVSRLWMLDVPAKNGKVGRSQKWIDGARELESACGEFGIGVLATVREAFHIETEKNGGVPPYTPSGPAGLVNPVAAFVARMRSLPGESFNRQAMIFRAENAEDG